MMIFIIACKQNNKQTFDCTSKAHSGVLLTKLRSYVTYISAGGAVSFERGICLKSNGSERASAETVSQINVSHLSKTDLNINERQSCQYDVTKFKSLGLQKRKRCVIFRSKTIAIFVVFSRTSQISYQPPSCFPVSSLAWKKTKGTFN